MNEKVRTGVLRSVQFLLGLDGVLHVAEVISAIQEDATRTAILTSIHACIFFAGVYFIGHDQKHHQGHHHGREGDS